MLSLWLRTPLSSRAAQSAVRLATVEPAEGAANVQQPVCRSFQLLAPPCTRLKTPLVPHTCHSLWFRSRLSGSKNRRAPGFAWRHVTSAHSKVRGQPVDGLRLHISGDRGDIRVQEVLVEGGVPPAPAAANGRSVPCRTVTANRNVQRSSKATCKPHIAAHSGTYAAERVATAKRSSSQSFCFAV